MLILANESNKKYQGWTYLVSSGVATVSWRAQSAHFLLLSPIIKIINVTR